MAPGIDMPPLPPVAWDRAAKYKFVQEVKKHEKTHIPYRSNHGDDSLRQWSVASSRS